MDYSHTNDDIPVSQIILQLSFPLSTSSKGQSEKEFNLTIANPNAKDLNLMDHTNQPEKKTQTHSFID